MSLYGHEVLGAPFDIAQDRLRLGRSAFK
jgi:hypothetical protein